MRILFVTPLFFPSLAGAAVYFDTLARAVKRRDPSVRVTILTRRLAGAPLIERREGVLVLRLLPRARPGLGLRARTHAAVTGGLILAISYALRSDVVHYHTLVSYRALSALAPLFWAALVGDMRDLAAADEGADPRVYDRCDGLICASENIVAYMRARGFAADRLAHVPVPFVPLATPLQTDVEAARAWLGVGDAPYVLYVGNLTPAKGVAELLDAMERLWPERPDLHLVLAGAPAAGSDPAFDHRLADMLRRDRRVHAPGTVVRDRVAALFAGAAVFVLPSRSEGLPRSCLEAFSLGVRVVLPPGIPEFARHCADAVLADVESGAIARAIDAALRAGRRPTYPLQDHAPDATAARTIAVWRAARARRHRATTRRR
ncbi:MAG: glycosyltransferase family 4 protein [Candidatus Rokubacteria bacterium]|nr:glycosyltransferase family 4 protein [Candidatus Rokubacteria bacterium]